MTHSSDRLPLQATRALLVFVLAACLPMAALRAESPWQNPLNRLDVNNDGFLAADDAVSTVNALNSSDPGPLPSPATPPPFIDVNGDEFLTPLDALLVINDLNQVELPLPPSFTPTADGRVEVQLDITDESGSVIDSVRVGDTFLVNAIVTDKSDEPAGVFASYFDIGFDPTLVSVQGDATFGEDFPNARRADVTTAGVVTKIGAFAGLTPLGPESLLFRLPFVAEQAGDVTFSGDSEGAFSLVFGMDEPVATEIRGASLLVVPEPSSSVLLATGCLAFFFRRSTRSRE